MTEDYFEYKFYFLCIKMEFQKITNFLDKTLIIKIYQNLFLKNGLKFMISQKEIITQVKELELKQQC